jgi:filamentous hemagglutinin family protein
MKSSNMLSRRNHISFGSFIATISLSLELVIISEYRVLAQASPAVQADGTLPSLSIVMDNGSYFEITGGTQSGKNLFHSFSAFSIPANYPAFFNVESSVGNVISRVTGGSVSEINGAIFVPDSISYPVNFFLLNPSGVILGKDASFDIGGSLIITSARSLRFADGSEFSALQTNSPVLSVEVPVGLQVGASAANISVVGPAHDLYQKAGTNEIARIFHPAGIQLNENNTLALVGGNITMNGGNITAFSGNVELGAVKSGYVGLVPDSAGWNLDYAGVTDFGDINLTGSASIDTSGSKGGSLNAIAQNISLSDGSLFLSQTTGNFEGRASFIRAKESIYLAGVAPSPLGTTEPGLPTSFISETSIESTGKAGNLTIETPILYLSSGAQISNGTYGPGSGGILRIQAQDITVTGSTDRAPTAIINNGGRLSTGNAGSVHIQTNNLTVSDNGLISSQNFGKGNGGSINIKAGQVSFLGSDVVRPTGTGLFAGADVGDGGKIQLDVASLSLFGGTQLTSFTNSTGRGGDIEINSKSIEVSGVNNYGASSGIYTIVQSASATGSAGNLILNTSDLLVTTGGQISASTQGIGNAGNLTVMADRLRVEGTNGAQSSGLFASVLPTATGNGGLLSLTTTKLEVLDGGRITTDSAGSGAAGNLSLKTSDLLVSNGGQISASTQGSGNAGALNVVADRVQVQSLGSISTAVQSASATGNAGNLTVKTGDLLVSDGGQISSNTQGVGNAGNLSVMADRIRIEGTNGTQASGLFASVLPTATGNGGLLSLTTNKLEVLDGGRITTDSAGSGAAGNLSLKTSDLLVSNGGQISASTQGSGNAGALNVVADRVQVQSLGSISTAVQSASATGNAGNLTVKTGDLLVSDGGQISSNTQGIGNAGNLTVMADRIRIEGSNGSQASGLFASVTPTATGQGGLLSIATGKLEVFNGGRITADSAGAGAAGSLNIKAQTIDIAGTSAAGPSALLGTVTGSGDGRDLTVVADRLTVRDGATIAVGNTVTDGTTSTQGSGRVGNLNLDIGNLTLSGGSLSAQSLTGDRGSINIRAKTLTLRYGSQINANALGDATGGNIDIQTQLLFAVLTENSDITANAITNRGGAVRIQTDQLLGLQASSRLSELSDITASSEQGAQFSGVVEIKASETDLSRSLTKLPTVLAGIEPIRVSCSATAGSLSTTGKGGLPVMADQPIRSGMLWGSSGVRVAAAIAPAPMPSPLVQANAWTRDAKGRVQLLARSAAQLPEVGCLTAAP